MTERRIVFDAEDLSPAFEAVGIEPATLTDYEWSKFADAFLAGTHWDEVARYAAEVVAEHRTLDH
jgi:hypothetical protein